MCAQVVKLRLVLPSRFLLAKIANFEPPQGFHLAAFFSVNWKESKLRFSCLLTELTFKEFRIAFKIVV